MDAEQLIDSSTPFLAWLADWYNDRPSMEFTEILEDANGEPARVAVMAVDVTSGFCSEGPLASERV